MKKTIYLLRHGHTPLTGTYIGSTDCPLSEKGIQQVKQLRSNAEFHSVKKIISSPMLRCRQTVETLQMNATVSIDKSLREIDFGRWETKTFSQISKTDPELSDSWIKNPAGFTFPEGESIKGFKERVEQSYKSITSLEEDEILVVAHGGMIRYLICRFLELDYSKFNSFKLEVASYAEIEQYKNLSLLASINKK